MLEMPPPTPNLQCRDTPPPHLAKPVKSNSEEEKSIKKNSEADANYADADADGGRTPILHAANYLRWDVVDLLINASVCVCVTCIANNGDSICLTL